MDSWQPVDCLLRTGSAPSGWGEAWFTRDGRYRWRLRRTWPLAPAMGEGECEERHVVFVMCNPSDAGATRDDATWRRCVGFAKAWGMWGAEAVNLSPKVAHRPKVMLDELASHGTWPPPWAEDNARVWLAACAGLHAPVQPLVVLAWGGIASQPMVADLAGQVRDRLALDGITWHALGFTAKGEPVHPLYLPAGTKLLTPDRQPWPF